MAADPASALVISDATVRTVTFENQECEPATRTITLPRGARSVRPMSPEAGDEIAGPIDVAATITAVKVVRRSGRVQVAVTATPELTACGDPARDEDPGWADDGDGTEISARYRRVVKVYAKGTGRGDAPAIRPRNLPFGDRSAVVGLSWSRWGGESATGSGSVEFNPCNPSCAEGRVENYPAQVTLSRPRSCDGQYRYTRFRFRYPGRRPAGFPASYRESFGC